MFGHVAGLLLSQARLSTRPALPHMQHCITVNQLYWARQYTPKPLPCGLYFNSP